MVSQSAFHYIFALFFLGSLYFHSAEANVFLGRDSEQAHTADVPLLDQIESLLGSERRVATETRAARIEDALRPTFAAMPKGADGGLNPATVRYMVHRYFVDRHGWFVRGLEASGDSWNSSHPAAVFKEHVGEHVHKLFEDKLGDHKGFSLHQVAVFAATLESFVHTETIERLHAAYRFSGLSQNEQGASKEQVTSVMETYMMMYVLGANHTSLTDVEIEEQRQTIGEAYPTWGETTKWVGQVRDEVVGLSEDTSFNSTMRVLEEIGDRYGRWQNSECLDLKDSLVKLEDAGTGRVRLDAFYKSALEGNWQFSESVSYLRQLGALDETDAQRPGVIIANYVNSPSNCVASSKFYFVCCIDECEALLSHVELHVAAPEAPSARILELVTNLPSATVQVPRNLPPALVQRLEEIAAQHGGTVPFHGRLFAQWMHHAFPRECQYPHLTGTTKPLSPDLWAEQTGEDMLADEETMRWHVDEGARAGRKVASVTDVGIDYQEELPWAPEEELFVSRVAATVRPLKESWAVSRGTALLGATLSICLLFVRMLSLAKESVSTAGCIASSNQKYFV